MAHEAGMVVMMVVGEWVSWWLVCIVWGWYRGDDDGGMEIGAGLEVMRV